MPTEASFPDSPEQKLVRSFDRNGCLRVPNIERRRADSRTYKMGYEIRLAAFTRRELMELRSTIRAAGMKPGKPFAKANRWIQPIYGRQAAEQFVAWLRQYSTSNTEAMTANWSSPKTTIPDKQTSKRRRQ